MTKKSLQTWYNENRIIYWQKEKLVEIGINYYSYYEIDDLKKLLEIIEVVKRNSDKFPSEKITRITFLSTWWNTNCALFSDSNGCLWVTIYDPKFSSVRSSNDSERDDLKVLRTLNHLSYERIKTMLNGDNPILVFYHDFTLRNDNAVFSPLLMMSNMINNDGTWDIFNRGFDGVKTFYYPYSWNWENFINNPDNYIKPLDILSRSIDQSFGPSMSHIGVYLGDGEVVHVSGSLGSSSSSGSGNKYAKIESLSEFLKGQRSISIEHCFVPFKSNNDIVRHVAKAVVKRYGERSYSIFDSNCEHFAWIVTHGVDYSRQAEEGTRLRDHAEVLMGDISGVLTMGIPLGRVKRFAEDFFNPNSRIVKVNLSEEIEKNGRKLDGLESTYDSRVGNKINEINRYINRTKDRQRRYDNFEHRLEAQIEVYPNSDCKIS